MQRYVFSLAAIAASFAASFTLGSRAGAFQHKFPGYRHTLPCWEAVVMEGGDTLYGVRVGFPLTPLFTGCGKTNAQIKASGLALAKLANIVPTGRQALTCDDNLDRVCCFHVDRRRHTITDVCTGIPSRLE